MDEYLEGLSVLCFSASWCVPCKGYKPTILKLSEEFKEVNFLHIDIDSSPELTEEYSIRSVPALVFLKDGELVDTIFGVHSFEELKRRMVKIQKNQ